MAKNITSKASNFSQWYQDVIFHGDLADQSPVRGCIVFKPNGFALWENIQAKLDQKFKETGHKNAYFPLLIPESFLQKEKDHIEGFAPELAVVTHAGGKKLEESLVIRPTSEAIIGSMYSKWIKSYRDLPVLINQWCSVMRWEMRPRAFLRTSEFLWQEGHTAHETAEEAEAEARKMLLIYRDFLEQDCLMPVLIGKKAEHEKFPGAAITYTLEALMQDGKALQAGTSHNLGQNFSKVFDIRYLARNNAHEYVWTTSWGMSTRVIGGIIMVHGDDDGIIMPPALAPTKVVLIPIWKNEQEKAAILDYSDQVLAKLKGFLPAWQIEVDRQEQIRPAERFFQSIQKGVPLRLEIGKHELEQGVVVAVRRDNREKTTIALGSLEKSLTEIYQAMATALYQKALAYRDSHLYPVDSYQDFKAKIEQGGFCFAHWDGTLETAMKIKEDTKATIRVIPENLAKEEGKCMLTGKKSPQRVIFAEAY